MGARLALLAAQAHADDVAACVGYAPGGTATLVLLKRTVGSGLKP